MASARSFDIDALDEDTLQVARAAAEAAGMSLEDWLSRTLGDSMAETKADDNTENPFVDAPDVESRSPLVGSAGEKPDAPIPAAEFADQPDNDATLVINPVESAATDVGPFASDRSDNEQPAANLPPSLADIGSAPSPRNGQLHAALHELADTLAPIVADSRWARRIEAIKHSSARTAEPVADDATVYMSAPHMDARADVEANNPPTADRADVGPDYDQEPSLGPPPDIPPAPVVAPASDLAGSAAEESPVAEYAAELDDPAPISQTDLPDDELQKAIAAAQARSLAANGADTRARKRRGPGGLLVNLLIGLISIAAVAVIAVLIYVWLNPETSIDEVTADITQTADDTYQSVVGQIDIWLGDTSAGPDGSEDVGAEPTTGDEPSSPAGGVPDPATSESLDQTDAADNESQTQSVVETSSVPEIMDGESVDGESIDNNPASGTALDSSGSNASESLATDETRSLPGAITAGDETTVLAAADQPAPGPASAPDADTAETSAGDAISETNELETLAAAGDVVAQRELGKLYLDGDGVAADPQIAHRWLEEASVNVNADPEAQFLLGTLYETGVGVEPDPLIAMAWYISSSENDFPQASLRLGQIYRDGVLWPQNYEDAAELFRAAADAGNAEAEFELAKLYEAGMGVDRSPLLANLWFNRAAVQGYPGADARAQAVAGALSSDQLSLAEQLMSAPPPTDTLLYGLQSTASAAGGADSTGDFTPGEQGQTATSETDNPSGVQSDNTETTTAADTGPQSTDATAPLSDLGDPVVVPPTPSPAIPNDGQGQTIIIGSDATGTTTPIIASIPPDPAQADPLDGANDLIAPAQLSPATIQEIQTILNDLGYASGRPDGVAGRRTAQAIRAYQLAEGLPVDGLATLTLLARLRSEPR